MKPPTIICPTCHNCGTIPMPEKLTETLRAFTGTKELIAADFTKGSKVGTTAHNNRLEKLRAMGFLKRRRQGKTWFYSLKGAR